MKLPKPVIDFLFPNEVVSCKPIYEGFRNFTAVSAVLAAAIWIKRHAPTIGTVWTDELLFSIVPTLAIAFTFILLLLLSTQAVVGLFRAASGLDNWSRKMKNAQTGRRSIYGSVAHFLLASLYGTFFLLLISAIITVGAYAFLSH